MTTDLLFQIFQQHLHEPDCEIVSPKEFIQKVVGTYVFLLTRKGNIPADQLDGVVEDLQSEVLEMFRKKTYGFYDLQEYRASLKRPSNSNDDSL
ncbi:MAG: hypothetical protein H7326_02280 [Bdellovibrionaceae bacterium]|nr:hypothetical protein [Pseudobdellovibrionaceae bacterium]